MTDKRPKKKRKMSGFSFSQSVRFVLFEFECVERQQYASVDDLMKHNLEKEMSKHKSMLNQHDHRVILLQKKNERMLVIIRKRNDALEFHIEIL